MISKTLRAIIVVTILCIVTSNIVYFGFVTNYSRSIFTKKLFTARYNTNVFKYRVLSKTLLLELDKVIDNDGSRFYSSVFYFNTFFLVLASIISVLLANLDKVFHLTKSDKAFTIFLIPILINISQFCIVPYDTSSYFFQLLIMLIFFIFYDTKFSLALTTIGILLILSTLNRESSALCIAFLFTIILVKYGLNRKSFISIGTFCLCFLLPYLAVRLLIKTPAEGEMPVSPLAGNLTAYVNVIGILFWLVFFYFTLSISNSKENNYLILVFHLLSLPYIFTVFSVGILWEVRLYVPLFICSLFLSKVNLTGYKYNVESYLIEVGIIKDTKVKIEKSN
jgi:hypothetical protein